MRVAGNKLRHLIAFFHSELKDSYPSQEIDALFAAAAEHVLGISKTQLLQKTEENINQSDLLKLYDCAKHLKKHIPLQYLLGETWFLGLKIRVNAHVLIPRPETEELVDLILRENPEVSSLLDIGTGSGCIPIALKKNRPQAEVFACDISKDALALAQKNAADNGTEVVFFEKDILRSTPEAGKAAFGILVSNPPYIKKSESALMEKNVLEHEPHLALFVEDKDAIVFYRRIIDLCSTYLEEGGKLYFELNPLTAPEVETYAKASGNFKTTSLVKDMSGTLRFFKGTKY